MKLIEAQWPAPVNVRAVTTTRLGGRSTAPYQGLNLGDHVADDPELVAENRSLLLSELGLTKAPQWLKQVHGTEVVEAADTPVGPTADACWSSEAGRACIVMTADCLPVFFCDQAGTKVAVAHAGWRGLADGVLEATLNCFANPEQVLAWLGPAIGPDAFEVGAEVREQFVAHSALAEQAFRASATPDKYLADLYLLAKQRLLAAGMQAAHISGGDYCTYTDDEQFFSYRRDGETGRMASVIWLAGDVLAAKDAKVKGTAL